MIKIALVLAAVAGLSACGQDHHPQYQQPVQHSQYQQPQPQPQYQQPPQQVVHENGVGVGTALVGAAAVGAAAYMVGKNAGQQQQPKETVVYKDRPAVYQPAPAPARPPVPASLPAAPQPAAKQAFVPVAAAKMQTVTPPKTSISLSKKR